MNPITYPIHERFLCFQGEGTFSGMPAFFVRTYGCPVHCPFCDSAGTWHPSWVPKNIQRMAVEEIVEEAVVSRVRRVVITGGEPTIFDLIPLVEALHEKKLLVHLETSGAFPINGAFDWITLSPKKWAEPRPESVARANEFKIIVEEPGDIVFYGALLTKMGWSYTHSRTVWLHPEWSQRENPKVLGAISEAVIKGGDVFRAGWQIHKLYQVDQLDGRSRPQVPLGGSPGKGF